ncbi:hypothetical protein BDV30DRAFT_215969 [Aspergillus minisclerotigenes]|uniref:Uncharacterized protein n=1 Tax=Aspergillus minisclerotigenes TaxID=656917 RepID=A0A5N6IVA3_9EURO|nr:hypothetical protein BDV30DRAFT_215969 [Aspergillus minisclerotigenes]
MIQGKGNLQTPVDYCSTLFGNAITIEIFLSFFFFSPLLTALCTPQSVCGHSGDQKR